VKKPKIAILCGGRGSRLKPLTDEVPKPLLVLNGKPVLDHILELYLCKGFREFILCVGYLSEKFRNRYEGDPRWAMEFSNAGEHASMLQRIAEIRPAFRDRIIVSYGDTITDLDLDAMLRTHEASQSLVTIAAMKIRSPFGLVDYAVDGTLLSLEEKPLLSYYIGHFILESAAVNYVTTEMLEKPDGEGLVEFFQRLTRLRRVRVYEHSGHQITFNTPLEKAQAEESLIHFYTDFYTQLPDGTS
jgi:glucose-1-phosphate cytidylyltransferase